MNSEIGRRRDWDDNQWSVVAVVREGVYSPTTTPVIINTVARHPWGTISMSGRYSRYKSIMESFPTWSEYMDCRWVVRGLNVGYIRDVCGLYGGWILVISEMYVGCTRVECWLYQRCMWVVRGLNVGYIRDACELYVG